MTERGKSHAAWNESIGQLKGALIKRQDAQNTSLTLNEFLEAKFQGTSRKVPSSAAFQVGIKYGIDPTLLTSVKKSAEQYIIARSGQVIYGENSFDLSGWSTDISEDGLTLAVGSILNDGANNENTGSVRVYTRENFDDAWVQKGVDIDGEAAQDYSGWSIALSDDGDRLVIGAVFNDDGVNENTGHVRVYDWNSTTSQWGQVGVDIEGGAAGDFFGYSVSLSKNKNFIAIGAPYGLNTRGYVGVYHYDAGSWNRIAYNLEGGNNGGLFGKRLSLSEDGSRLVVSAPHDFKDRGLLFLYRIDQVNNSIVLLSSKLGRDSGVKFGNSFDFKSNRLVVSETGVNQPRITTYDLSSDTFTPLPEQTITLDGPIDIHLKLSYDGNHLVYGMPGFNSEDLVLNSRPIPTGIRQTGHAEIYEREGDRWVKRGWRMSGVSSRDEFAKAVTISGSGEIVCLSVPRKDVGGTDKGCVTAYTVKPISYYVTPSITLSGLNPFPLQANTDYAEPGATTDTGATVTITGDIEDNTVEGQEYEITYTSQNGFGSVVTKTRRIVITKDPTIPTMTLNGDAIVKIPIGGVFNDPSVTTSILSTVNIDTSNVNTSALGAYEIKYTAVSSYGIPSQQEITRTLVVVYEAEFYGTPQVGTVSCMSRDGFILAVGDFIDNSVRLYEWDLIQEDWVRIGQQIEGPDDSSFGAAIDLSADGLTVVIGAPTYSDSLTGLVRVYHFDFITNQWEQKGGDIIDGASGDNLGEFVAISGDGGVVSCGTARPTGSKNPYVFTYRYANNTDSWSKFHTYTEPVKLGSSIVSNQFTGSLNFNGSRLLLGVPVNNYTTGAVFLYDTDNDEKLASILGTNVGDNLGQSVRLSGDGNRFAIGDVTNGCVKIYSENKITRVWNQLGSKIYDGNGGTAVALSDDGNIVTYSVMSGVNRGTIYQYRWDGTFWMPSLQEFTDSIDGNRFGRKLFVTDDGSKLFTESNSSFQLYRWNIPRASVTFNGSRIIRRQVDQVYDYDYVVTSSNVITEGIVNQAVTNDYLIKYIVTKNEQSDVAYQLVSVSGQLLQLGLNIYNYDESATPNNHGWSSSMSNDGNYLVVSSPGYDNDRGMIKIYTFNPVTIHWDTMTSLTGPNAGGNFGYSVAFSGDGSRVAVGAPNHGNGLVRVYEYSDSTWTQIGSDLSGSAGGKFGWSVSLNNTGSYVTVGEPRKVFGVNTGVGEVHTFAFSTYWYSVSSKSFTNNQIEHQFGYAVDISSTNNVVVFGAPTAGPGYVKISSYISGNVPIFAQPITFGERFGWCVTVSDNGQVFAAGAPFYNNKRGRVLVYDATTTPPTVKGSPIVGENINDELGSSIHLVGDGSKIMVYTKKGRVTNYQYVNSEWVVISDQVITSSELDTDFGYSLSSSGDGSRMTITAPLSGSGVGLAQVFSDETSQITASDFVPPVLSLNGPSLFRHEKDTVYTEPGVIRDDAETSFITQGSVNSNVADSYTLTYTAQDIGGNISNSLNRIVDVIDPSAVNNRVGGLPAPWNGANNSSMHLSGNGKRVAVCYGVNPETYPPGTRSGGRSGTVGVYDIDDTVFPLILTQYGQEITSTDELFATSINLSQDGNKLSVMTTVDDDTTKISVYGINNTVLTPASTPFFRYEESSLNNNTFSLPNTPIRELYDATHYSPDSSTTPTQVHNIHLFGQEYKSNAPDILVGTSTSTTNEYRYSQVNESKYRPRSMATSKDGKTVAFGHSDKLSVYRFIDTETIVEVFSVQHTGPVLGSSITLEAGDFSEDGQRFITTDSDNTTSIYRVNSGSLQKEIDFFNSGDGKNALSHNGVIAAYTTPGLIDYKIITLIGGDRVTTSYGETWTDPGFTYNSDPDDPNDVVTVSGDDFDTNVEGDHVVMYQTPTSQQIRIVKVLPQVETFTGSFSTTNIPYGPSFAGWTGTWRSQDFALFTVPTNSNDFSPENYTLTITLNGTIPVAGNWQYMSIEIYTDDGFSSSISFTSDGSGQGESYSYNTGTVYTDKVKTTTAISSGTLNVGDQVRGRLHLYNTFFSTFNVSVEIQNTISPLRTPVITLTGFSEFSISSTENFTDPGFTSDNSGDALSKTIDPTFPISTSTRKAIVYKAQSSDGINGYAVRYVNVEIRPSLVVKKFQNNTWSTFGNPIIFQINEYTIGGLVLSEDGTKLAISQYTSGRGLIYTYEYSQNVYPAGWVQYGSVIDITKSQSSPGFSIAMSGNGLRLVVGIPADTTVVSGNVRVFNYTNTTWQEHTQATSLHELTGGQVLEIGPLYGYSVDISKDGTHIIVGSPIVNTSWRGHVSVFELSGDAYILKGSPLLRDSSEPEFGRIVSISSDGNYFVTNSGASYAGGQKVVYYKYFNNTWVEHGSGITSVTSPVISTKISGDGTKILTLMDSRNVNIYSPTTTSISGGWGQLGSDINLNSQSINLPPVETLNPVQPGSRSSPRGRAGYEYIEFDTTGLVVDISHDGTVLAVGLPMLKFRDDLNHTNITGGAAIVFDYDVNTDAWVQSGGMIVPKYVWNPNLQDMYYADGYTGTKTFSNLDLNQRAEANMFSGASISLSGDGQYLCVGSPGYVSNPVDIITTNTYNTTNERMHALPNRAGASSWTLFRRNSAWSPTDDHFSVGWEPLGTKYSDMSESLKDVYGVSNVDERKREMLGLSVKVASDGSFVAYDTRTDGVKVATLGGSKEVVTAVSLPSTNSFGRYDVNDTAFGTMVPQATQNSATNYEYEINGVVSVPDWDSSVSGQDHTDAVLPLHPETPKTTGDFWRGVPMLHVYSPLLFTVYPDLVSGAGDVYDRNINPSASLDTIYPSGYPNYYLPIPDVSNNFGRDLIHAFIRDFNPNANYSGLDVNQRGETNFGFGDILSTSKDCKFMVTRRHLWGEFASGGLTNWEGGTGTDGLKAQSHIHKWVNHPSTYTNNRINGKNLLTDYHSFSEVYVYYRNSPSDDWVQRGSTSDLRALRYSDVGKKYLIPRNYIYRTLLQDPGHADINNTESTDTTELAKHCGLVLWMENFGTESKISDDGMTLLISNFIGVAADYQINIKGGRGFGSQERWETYMPLDEMNDFGNAVYVYKYNTTTGNWDPKSHGNLTSDTYVETGFAMGYNSEFGTVEYVSGADYWMYDANIKDDVFNVNNVDHTQAPYPIFPSYFDSRMRSSDILTSFSIDPGWSQSRKKRNLDYTSQFARSVSLSGNGNVIAICEPNWNPIYDGNDIGDIRAGSLTGYSPYTFGNPNLHQRIHNDFCRSTVTTGPVSTQRDYNSEDGNFTPFSTLSNQYSHLNPGHPKKRGGDTNYWVPLKGMTDGYSTTQDYRHFESSSYVANGFRKAVRPGDCGRVLFMKWNEAQDIYDVDRTLPPFYSIQLLNYVEEDVRQKRYEINSDTTSGQSYGGFQYTVFKCELNSLGDEVTFFASYPSDFMERHGITDVRVGIYTFKLTDAVDISNLTDAEISALDPLSYYTISDFVTGAKNHTNTNTYPAGWELGYTKYWKLKSKILTSQFTSPINVGVNTQLYFKGDTTLVHSGPNFDWHKQDPGTATRDPLYLRDPLSTTEQSSFPTLQYPNWYPSGERREDDKNARILSRRRYVNNWRSGHAANFHGGRSHEEQQNPLDLKVYDGTDTILFRDSQRVYLFKNGVNKTENLCVKTFPTPTGTVGTVMNAAYAPAVDTLLVSSSEVDFQTSTRERIVSGNGMILPQNYTITTTPQVFISMYKFSSDAEEISASYDTFETIFPARGGSTSYYDIEPSSLGYVKSDDIVVDSSLAARFTTPGYTLALNSDATTILFSSGADYTRSHRRNTNLVIDWISDSAWKVLWDQNAPPPHVFMLHEFTQIHTLTKTDTTITQTTPYTVQQKLSNDTTKFLQDQNIFTRSAETGESSTYQGWGFMESSLTADTGYGAYPAKFWPTSYLSLSTNDRFLTVSEPVLDPLGLRYSMWNGTDLTPEQNEDLRMGKVTVYDDFIQLGQVITDTPQTTLTPNIDEFAYSESTISPDGKTVIVPYSIVPNKFGSLSPGNFQKGFSIFSLSDVTTTWSKTTSTSVVDTSFTFDGTGGGTGNDFVPEETTFVSLLTGDRVSSFFGGGRLMNTDNTYQVVLPVFRQYQVFNTIESSTVWNKIRPDITLTSTDLNRQHWNSNVTGAPSRDERVPDFAMSNDGSVIVIGNENDEIQFTSVNNATRKSGSVSVYKYDTTRLLWNQQKVTVDDDVSSGLATTPYVPARFGRSLALTSDGNSLVVSAPNNRDRSGDIFLFDTSSTTATKKALTLQNPGGSEFGYSLAVNDDLTRLFIGDPYYSTGSDTQIGRVWVKEYDSTVASGNTLPNGFSGASGVYINPGNDVYNPEYNSVTFGGYSELLRFGEAIDVSSDGNHLIASRFGRFSVADMSMQLTYMSIFGTIEVAEKWDRNEQTGIWELENIPRINATTEFDLRTGSDAVTPPTDPSEFQYLSDDQPRQPNVKISDSGETFFAGVESIGRYGTSSVQSNISIFRNSYDFTPVLILNGPSVVEIGLGNQYIEQGVTSDSSEDTITTTGTVDNTKIGNYILRYSTVRRGLSSFIERTVRVVVQNVQPTVTLIGSESIELEQPTTYTEPDPPVTFSGGVLETYGVPPDGSSVGVFTIRYQVRNPVGIATATRTVTILPDTTPPVVTKFGGDVIHKVNTNYRDASYIGSDGNEDVIRTTPSYVRTITDVGQYRGTTEITYSAVDSAGNVGTVTRNVDVKDVMEATLLEQQLDASYYSTISGDGSRIALIRETTNDVILYDLPASTSTFVGGWNGLGSMEGQMVKLSSDGQIVAFTASDGVRVYAYVSGSWVERTAATSRFAVPGSFMYEIDMSDDGSTISVSYPGGNDQYLEEVVVFSWNGTEYVEEHSIANGTATATGLGSAMSLSSNGSRLALGSPTYNLGSVLSLTSDSVILRGVFRIRDYYRLTSYGYHGENNTMYWPTTLGSKWSLSWQWYIYGPRWGGADDMRLIYYATNPITAYQASVHNGYNNFYEFWQGDTHQIRDNRDVYRKTQNVYYGTSRWLDVNVSYDNGIMTSTIMDRSRLVSTLTHDFGTEHQHLYGTPTYIGFSGRTGGVTSSQFIRHINFSGGVVNGGELEVYERTGNLWTQLGNSIEGGSDEQGLGSSVKLSGDGSTLVNVSNATDGNKQKVNVFSLTNGIWTKKPTLIDNLLKRTGFNGNTNDLVDVSDDGSLLIYAKGVGSERYTSHPDGLSTKYIDGFKLEGGEYIPVLLIPESATTSLLPTKHIEVSGDGSKVLIHAGDQVDVYTVTETVFNPVITLSYRDDLDTLTTTSYTEQGATSNVTDVSLVTVGGDVVTNTPGTYRVTYTVTDTNSGKSAHRTRIVIIKL